jgi:hypothetical protein
VSNGRYARCVPAGLTFCRSELEYDIRSHSPLQDTRNQVPTPSLPTRTSRTQTQGASAAVSAHSGSETGHKRQVMLACSSREATQGGTQLTDRPAAPGGPDRPSQRRRSPGSTAHLARLRHQLPSESLISLTPLGHPLPPRQLPSYQRLISGSEDSTQTPPYSHWPQQPSAWASQQPVLSAGSSNPLHPAPPWPVRNSNSALPLASSGGTQPADSQGSNILPWEHDGRTSPAQHPQRERAGAYVSGPSLRLPGFRSPPLDPDRAREAADRAFEARQKFRRQRGDI